ncbi:MAG TPA: enoyl-CoA hydratase-related protein [Bryobacteraceae bacterium]|nr:enoyl-CoA hydratase-related protein [Bryobacteraceae bacterium]
MAEESRLLVSLKNGVKRITFNAPERRNAVDRATSERLLEVVQETARDESKVVVLTGAGEAFCAGADLSSSRPGGDDVTDFLRRVVNPTVVALREMPKPVIARVHGHAVGVGCNYALAADIRIASTEARFGQVFAKIGLIPDGGSTYFLPRMIGYPRAFEWMVTGAIIDAKQAAEWGLVNGVVPVNELDEAVDAWTSRLSAGAALAIAGIKRALAFGEAHTLAEALECEAVTQQTCYQSRDFREGVAAFREKRKAVFQGK